MVYELLGRSRTESSKAVFFILELGQLFDCLVKDVCAPHRSSIQAGASKPIVTPFSQTALSHRRLLAWEVTLLPSCPFGRWGQFPPRMDWMIGCFLSHTVSYVFGYGSRKKWRSLCLKAVFTLWRSLCSTVPSGIKLKVASNWNTPVLALFLFLFCLSFP